MILGVPSDTFHLRQHFDIDPPPQWPNCQSMLECVATGEGDLFACLNPKMFL
jgi:hypothetical protein